MKLTRRNSGTAYGARVDGIDFHIYRVGKSWRITARQTVTTVGVEHALGCAVVLDEWADTLREVREALDYLEEFAHEADIRTRYRKAYSAATVAYTERIRAELNLS